MAVSVSSVIAQCSRYPGLLVPPVYELQCKYVGIESVKMTRFTEGNVTSTTNNTNSSISLKECKGNCKTFTFYTYIAQGSKYAYYATDVEITDILNNTDNK
jgi:hypothetical protein